jgi:hypothetical protein
MSNQELIYEEYNDNSYAVRGDKKKYAKKIKDIGGRWNPRMKGGEGWLVPKENLENLKNLVQIEVHNELDRDLKVYQRDNILRKLPDCIDGSVPSSRKVIYTAQNVFGNSNSEMKVNTFVNSNMMEELPIILYVKNKDIFSTLFYNTVFCYLRKSVYEHIISKDENSFFDLEQFGKLYFNDNPNRVDLITKLSTEIQLELKELGWNCKLSFGGTALFIYSTDNPPPSCWDDGLQ